MKIYLGCSLFGASPEYLEQIESIKEQLRQRYQLIEFLGLGDSSPEQVVEYDLGCVREADCMVAICNAPSIGMGIEIGLCNSLKKPVLLVAQTEQVSKMVRGNHVENPRSQFVTYDSIDDLMEQIAEFTQTHQ